MGHEMKNSRLLTALAGLIIGSQITLAKANAGQSHCHRVVENPSGVEGVLNLELTDVGVRQINETQLEPLRGGEIRSLNRFKIIPNAYEALPENATPRQIEARQRQLEKLSWQFAEKMAGVDGYIRPTRDPFYRLSRSKIYEGRNGVVVEGDFEFEISSPYDPGP